MRKLWALLPRLELTDEVRLCKRCALEVFRQHGSLKILHFRIILDCVQQIIQRLATSVYLADDITMDAKVCYCFFFYLARWRYDLRSGQRSRDFESEPGGWM